MDLAVNWYLLILISAYINLLKVNISFEIKHVLITQSHFRTRVRLEVVCMFLPTNFYASINSW